jgi:TetR/AcrR family transcriptional regulator
MASSRRIGIESSATRALLLDAAKRIMQQQGYAALTSRQVAAEAGLKPQLVHYYFRTMDDLLLALVRRGNDEALRRLARAVASEDPLQALWKLSMDPTSTVVTMEIMAVANHHSGIREEVRRYAEQFRNIQAEAIGQYAERHGVRSEVSPLAATLMMAGLAQVLLREKALGMTLGHAEVESGVKKWQDEFAAKIRASQAAATPKKNSSVARAKRSSTRQRKRPQGTNGPGAQDGSVKSVDQTFARKEP